MTRIVTWVGRHREHPGSAWVVDATRAVLEPRRPGESLRRPAPPATGVTWAQVADALGRHRLVSLIAPHAIELGVPEPLAQKLHHRNLHHRGHGLKVVHDSAQVTDWLAAAGIDVVVMKGAALASLLWGEPSSRGAGDVDILVRAGDVATVEQMLVERGWHRQFDWLPPTSDVDGWARLLRRGNELAYDHPVRCSIDVHWYLSTCDEIGLDDLLAASVPLPEIGPNVRTLGPQAALAHMAEHGRKEAWPVLRQIVEIVRLVELCGPTVTADAVRRDPTVAAAVVLAGRLAPWIGGPALALPRSSNLENLAEQAWRGCLGLRLPGATRRSLRGWAAVGDQVRMYVWHVRTEPTLERRARAVVRGAVPSRGRVGSESLPVALSRFARQRVLR